LFNQTIRKITRERTNWVTTTIAGLAGTTGSDDGTNSDARFNYPVSIVVDHAGNLYVEENGNNTIRKITPVGTNWVTTTIAGLAGVPGYADGTNSAARFSAPNGLALDSAGNLYVGEPGNESTIRKITPVGADWVTTTIAGLPHFTGSADGTNSAARFSFWYFGQAAVAVGSGGNLYVADVDNQTIRRITPVGTNWVTTTIAGLVGNVGSDDGTNSAARFNEPSGVAADSAGNVYVSDTVNNTIRKLTPAGTNWVVTTIAGVAGQTGSDDGINSAARFNGPTLLKVDSHGTIFVPDQVNNTIRMGVPLPVFQSVAHTNDHIALTWSAAPGQTFQLQYKSDLTSATWTNLGSPITAASGTISATDTAGPDQHRFYRVIVQP
jgi:NHL repeat